MEWMERILQELTLDEKIGMIHGDGLFRTKGVPRLNIPAVKLSDGPMGVRNELQNEKWIPLRNSDDYVTYLPCNSALAATWNRELAYQAGKVLGEEARGRGKDVILAPGINIKRSPLCGRNFEYMSEDPCLCAEIAVPLIQGIQRSDVAACVKHFALNNQETERCFVEAEVSDRALREIYLYAFEKAVKKGNTFSLMGAYSRYKGAYCCESKILLNDILRGEWGYDGMVVSDWGAVHDTYEAAAGGLDMEMSVTDDFDDYYLANPLKEAVKKGEIAEELIDEKVRNILRMMKRLHMLEPGKRRRGCYNTPEHRMAALEAARESVVLLKNEAGKLPLDAEKVKRVLVIGDNADRVHSCGGGSAEVKALYEISPLMGIKKFLGGNAEVVFARGYFADNCDIVKEDNWQANSLENGGGSTLVQQKADEQLQMKRNALKDEAVDMAENGGFDTVIMVGGLNHAYDLEGNDRADMKLPYGQDELIGELLEVRPDTVVIMAAGSPVEMPWIDRAGSLIWHWYAGMEGGTALAEVLFGVINPSGKLPETFPMRHTDCPAHCIGEFPGQKTAAYREDIFVGYRYYDTEHVPVLFPFGYGLSYTEFLYSDLRVDKEKRGSEKVQEEFRVSVSLNVTNIGNRAGKEIVQIYVGKRNSGLLRAAKELKAFTKILLEPQETRTVTFELGADAFAYYDEEQKCFSVEPGIYTVYAGKSVAEICLASECSLS